MVPAEQSKNIEYCSPTLLAAGTGKAEGRCQASIVRGKNDFVDVIRNRTSADFFKIYAYDFVSGRPFTRKEVEGKEAVCVITDALAERLFGKGMDAVGQTLVMEHEEDLRIIGVVRSGSQLTPDSYVVRSGSQLTPDSYADIIMPYTLVEVRAGSVYAGLYSIVATVKDDEHLQALKEEIDGIANRLTQFLFRRRREDESGADQGPGDASDARAPYREPRQCVRGGDGVAIGHALRGHPVRATLRASTEPLRYRGWTYGATLGGDGRAQDLWRQTHNATESSDS